MKHAYWYEYSSRDHIRTGRFLVHNLHKLVRIRAANVLRPVRSLLTVISSTAAKLSTL